MTHLKRSNTGDATQQDSHMDICYHSMVGAGLYSSNCYTSISEHATTVPILKDKCFNERVAHYQKLQLVTHENLLQILQVLPEGNDPSVVYWKDVQGEGVEGDDVGAVGFGSVASARSRPFFSRAQFYDPLDIINFKLYVRHVLKGLAGLHKRGLHHGSLSLDSIYYYHREGANQPLIKLGGFQYKQGALMDLIFQDFYDFGRSLETLMCIYPKWAAEREFVEIKDLCTLLKTKHMGLSSRLHSLTAVQVSELCQEVVLGHVVFLHHEERPSYIMAGVAHLEFKELMDNIQDADLIFPGEELTIDRRILPTLVSVGAIPKDIKSIPAGKKARYYVKMVRNEATHEPKKPKHVISAIVGTTTLEIEQYFRKEQPKVVLALQKALCGTGFKYASFVAP